MLLSPVTLHLPKEQIYKVLFLVDVCGENLRTKILNLKFRGFPGNSTVPEKNCFHKFVSCKTDKFDLSYSNHN